MNIEECYGMTVTELKAHIKTLTKKDLTSTYRQFRGLKSKGKNDILMEQILENEIDRRNAIV